jgi:hypothetical protein
MRRSFCLALSQCLLAVIVFPFCAAAQGARGTDDCAASALNIPEAKYPCLYPDHRALFRVVAPDAQKVRVRIGPGFDMTKGPDGIWSVTTTPLVVGFHYYSLQIGRPAYTEMMFTDLVPMIERTYRVRAGKESRAMAGLSMGGAQTFATTLTNVDRFAYIGGFSGNCGGFGRGTEAPDMTTICGGAFADSAAFNAKVRGCSSESARRKARARKLQ